jgi:tryptophanyl-tRNA synthetase
MSKTDQDPGSYIALLDDPEVIAGKIKKAVTGSGRAYPSADDGSGTANLMTIYAAVNDCSFADVASTFTDIGYAEFKEELTESVCAFLGPIRARYADIRRRENLLEKILENGAERARERARRTLKEVHRAIGLYTRG